MAWLNSSPTPPCSLLRWPHQLQVKEKSDKEVVPYLAELLRPSTVFRVDPPSFFAGAATLGFLGVFRVLNKVFFCMAGSPVWIFAHLHPTGAQA